MTVDIENTSQIKYDTYQLNFDVKRILTLLEYEGYGLSVTLTDNETIQKYNREYRKKDKPTDVLSFPFHPETKAGERIEAQSDDDKHLGDIIISLEYVKDDAKNWGHTFEQRMRVLLVHGIYHLLGYDHVENSDYEIMKKQEGWLLHELSIND